MLQRSITSKYILYFFILICSLSLNFYLHMVKNNSKWVYFSWNSNKNWRLRLENSLTKCRKYVLRCYEAKYCLITIQFVLLNNFDRS